MFAEYVRAGLCCHSKSSSRLRSTVSARGARTVFLRSTTTTLRRVRETEMTRRRINGHMIPAAFAADWDFTEKFVSSFGSRLA
jgi:hypothetical protein